VIVLHPERLAFFCGTLSIELIFTPTKEDINAALKGLRDGDELADVMFDLTGQADRYVQVIIIKVDISFSDTAFITRRCPSRPADTSPAKI